MGTKLNSLAGLTIEDLSKEEIGRLFPVEVIPYDRNWVELFKKEKPLLLQALGEEIALRIEHFGSTAVPNLAAKPTIDILVEIPPLTPKLKERIISKMKAISYQFIWRADCESPYMMFAKGYDLVGITEQTFHIHMGQADHPLWDRLYFRDYLIENPEIAKQYEKLKIDLASKHKYDREDYTNAKTEFIATVTNLAIEEMKF